MALSISAKQNGIYSILVLLTLVGTIFLYRSTQQEWIFFREAESKLEQKEFQAAIALYKKSVSAGLPLIKVSLNLANSNVAIGNFNEAIILYRKYLAERPKDTRVRLELARVLFYIGNFSESEIEYKKVLEDIHDDHKKN